MDSQKVLYNKTGDDESYTFRYCVEPIIKYIPKDAIVWCPFDKEHSEFVKQIRANGNSVILSHIDDGRDFFEFEPIEWDVIVSNPPFKRKREFFERALSFNKPFALIMTNAWLNDSAPKKLFKDKDLELLMFTHRMLFLQNGEIDTRVTFSSSYYCYDFLPKQIIIEDLMTPAQFKRICEDNKQLEDRMYDEYIDDLLTEKDIK